MATLEEGLRHFWLRDIHNVVGVTGEGLREWLLLESFIFQRVVSSSDFAMQVLSPSECKRAIAHDSTRMASASFETMLGIGTVSKLPKSAAWILIRAYYAAFFAAHGLLRTLGVSCIQLDHQQTAAFDHVASAFGMLPGTGFEQGFYIAKYNSNLNEIHFYKSAAARRGSHQILWEIFADTLRSISNHLLTVSSAFNNVALQLSDVEMLLRQDQSGSGSWLSEVRNFANYRQEYGLWFPYANSQVDGHELMRIVKRWKADPKNLFPINQTSPIVLHVWICTVIVSICHAVVTDVEAHAVRRRCFHSFGSLALARLAGV